jgi:hypothetical protein
VSQPLLKIVPADTRPRVTWKARPSTLVLGEPQAPRRLTLGLSVECVAYQHRTWPWALVLLLGAVGLIAAGMWR